jgi:hypothetical protein
VAVGRNRVGRSAELRIVGFEFCISAMMKSEYGGIFTSALPLAPVDFESAPSSDSEDDNLLEENFAFPP